MIYFKDNEYFIENTDIEIKQFKNGIELNKNELANPKVKPDYYKIYMLEFIEREFKTIPAIKQYLKSEIVIQRLMNSVMDNNKDTLGLLKQLKEQKKEFIIVKTKLDEWDNIDKLSYKQQLKITKWIRKNKGK